MIVRAVLPDPLGYRGRGDPGVLGRSCGGSDRADAVVPVEGLERTGAGPRWVHGWGP